MKSKLLNEQFILQHDFAIGYEIKCSDELPDLVVRRHICQAEASN